MEILLSIKFCPSWDSNPRLSDFDSRRPDCCKQTVSAQPVSFYPPSRVILWESRIRPSTKCCDLSKSLTSGHALLKLGSIVIKSWIAFRDSAFQAFPWRDLYHVFFKELNSVSQIRIKFLINSFGRRRSGDSAEWRQVMVVWLCAIVQIVWKRYLTGGQ